MSENSLQSTNSDADEALNAISSLTNEAILVLTEQMLESKIEGVQSVLDLQVRLYPLAESELRNIYRSRISNARLALLLFRETGRTPSQEVEEILEVTKRQHWEDLVAIGQVYPDLDIVTVHDMACAQYDAAHAEYLQKLAAREAEHRDQMSGIRNATLERMLGEISEEQFIDDVESQL